MSRPASKQYTSTKFGVPRNRSSPDMTRDLYITDPLLLVSKSSRKGLGNTEAAANLDQMQNGPNGVTDVMASRMRLDVLGSPHMLDLRMNNQNLKNELILHRGKIISNQLALMKPRRRTSNAKPFILEMPGRYSAEKQAKMDKVIEKKESTKRAAIDLATHAAAAGSDTNDETTRCVCGNTFLSDAKFCRKCGKPRPSASPKSKQYEDPEMAAHIMSLLKEGKVEEIYRPLEVSLGSLGTGLPHDKVCYALKLMGFAYIDEAKVRNTVNMVATGAPLSLEEFARVVCLFERERNRELFSKFQELDEDHSGTVTVRELRHLLWDLGYTVTMGTVEEIVNEVDDNNSGAIDFKEFSEAVKIISERRGFTAKEMADLFDLFDRYDADSSGEISADELASLLGYFGTPTTIKQAAKIVAAFDNDGDGTLGKNEFLSVMRIRLEDEISDLRTLFAEFDTDSSGTVDREEVIPLIHSLNYSVMPAVIDEAISDVVDGGVEDGLVFEDVLKVVTRIRDQEGFSRTEVEELREVFRQHDVRHLGELREFELARALNWLGYPLSHQKRRQYWCKVDVDKTDNIDDTEFLKYIRLLREDETVAAKALLHNNSSTKLRESGLRDMLNKLGYAPPPALIEEALNQSPDSSGDGMPDLIGVLGILRYIRDKITERLRQSAGLPDQLQSKVRSKFALRVEAGKRIEPADAEKFMHDVFKMARNSPEEVEAIKAIIQEQCKGGNLGLMEMFWVVRLFGDKRDEAVWRREQDAAAAANFSAAQVAQFRSKFVAADGDGSGYLSEREIQGVFDDVIKLDLEQVKALQKEFGIMGAGAEYVDFPEFLRLMRVVSDTSTGETSP